MRLALAALLCSACGQATYLEVVLHSDGAATLYDELQVHASNGTRSAMLDLQPGAFSLPPEKSFVLELQAATAGEVDVDVRLLRDHAEVAHAAGGKAIRLHATTVLPLQVGALAGGDGGLDGGEDLGRARDGASTVLEDGFAFDGAPPVADAARPPTLASFEVSVTANTHEHEVFDLQITALDSSGSVVADYARAPTITADWGDLTITGLNVSNGQLTAHASLNRETSSPVHDHVTLTVIDGNARGTSSGIQVGTMPFTVVDTQPVFGPAASGWDQLISTPVWTRRDGTYYLWYIGAVNSTSGSTGYGLATSKDGAQWKRYGTAAVLGTAGDMPSNFHPAVDCSHTPCTFAAPYHGGVYLDFVTSPDGIAWTKTVPQITPQTASPCGFAYNIPSGFVTIGGVYRVYSFETQAPCYIESGDQGKTWSPTQPTSGFPNQTNHRILQVIKEGSVYKLWYTDDDNSTIYATSSDGAAWAISPYGTISQQVPTILWNDTLGVYEALYYVGNGFGRMRRP